MRVHAIQHPTDPKRFLVNYARPCAKPPQSCDIVHLNVFSDEELSRHELQLASDQLDAAVMAGET